jgi:hypothetical protein
VYNVDKFNFFLPAEFEKAADKSGKKIMRIKGIASTCDEDSEGEILEPIGYSLDRFLQTGFINYNHLAKSDAAKIIGEPEIANVTKDNKLYLEGRLYNTPLAKSVYNLADTLKSSKSNRRLGWSIEGRAVERDPSNPKRIIKALITGVAITPSPVNANTYVDIVKGTQKKDYIEYDFSIDPSNGMTYLLEYETEDGSSIKVNRDFSIVIKKNQKKLKTNTHSTLDRESMSPRTYNLRDWDYIYKAYTQGYISKDIFDKIINKMRDYIYLIQ